MKKFRSALYRGIHALYLELRGYEHNRRFQFLNESQWWPRQKVEQYQNEQMNEIIRYAYCHVPYYRKVMNERGLKPEDIKTTADLIKMPVLTKDGLRKNWNDLISSEAKNLRITTRHTGGSTGEPLQIAIDQINGAWEAAAYLRGLGFAGFRKGDTVITLFGGSLGLAPTKLSEILKAKLAGEVFLPAFEISKESVGDYVRDILKSKADFLNGYSSAIFLLAQLMKNHGLAVRLKAVFPTAETLYDFQRELIEEVFQCRVFNLYGCGELNSIAFECSAHCGLHITDENVYLEVLHQDEPVPEGTMGALTLTALHNYAMPLIRYQNGDVIALKQIKCSCGRNLSFIQNLFGRSNDLLMATNGQLISGAFIPHLFRTSQGIKEIQVVQESRSNILLRTVKGPKFNEEELAARVSVITKYLGDVVIKVEYVDDIPRTPRGKLRSVISKIEYPLLHVNPDNLVF